MGILVRTRAKDHQSGLMELQRLRGVVQLGSGTVDACLAEPRLPSGWEKCLDLKSGLIYFKDWNSGTLTYRDPRQQSVAMAAQQRIGLLSISTSSPAEQILRTSTDEEAKSTKRKSMDRFDDDVDVDEQSLELSLNLPGTPSTGWPRTTTTGSGSGTGTGSSSQEGSVCTMAKVRSALERSQWLQGRTRQPMPTTTTSNNNDRTSTAPTTTTTTRNNDRSRTAPTILTTTLSLLSSSSSPSCTRLHLESRSTSDSAATSQCSSECFTSPSVMSFQGDDEEVQQPGEGRAKSLDDSAPGVVPGVVPGAVMVTVGCKSCLMYVMLSKSHPCCPKCGNTDVLLELPPAPPPKVRRTLAVQSPSWSWCTA